MRETRYHTLEVFANTILSNSEPTGPEAEIEIENLSAIAVFEPDIIEVKHPKYGQRDCPEPFIEKPAIILREVWLAKPVSKRRKSDLLQSLLEARAKGDHYVDGGLILTHFVKAEGEWFQLLQEITDSLGQNAWDELQSSFYPVESPDEL